MARRKHIGEVIKLFSQSPVVTARDIELIVGSRAYAYLLLHNLSKHGRIKRLTKGYYTVHGDPTLTVFCYRPAYIGLQDALSIHNLWTQETNVVIVTARNIRGEKTIIGARVIIHRLKPEYYFGYHYVKYEKFYIPVSDVEKTMIDLAYFNSPIHPEIAEQARQRVDREKLLKYMGKYEGRVRRKIERRLQPILK